MTARARIGPPLLLALLASVVSARQDAKDERRYDGRTIAEWTQVRVKGDQSERRAAAYALGRAGPAAAPALDALTAALDDADDTVRYHAVHALGKLGKAAKPAIPALVKMLKTARAELG